MNNLKLNIIPLLKNGELDLSNILNLLKNVSLVSIIHVSNVLGIENKIYKLIEIIRNTCNALILIDGAQYISHDILDVKKLDCDFYVFSGYKMYGPSGVGILYIKKHILNNMVPWQTGGGIVTKVSLDEDTLFVEGPSKFEAGSPNISGIIGLGAALKYINKIGIINIKSWEKKLTIYALEELKKIKKINIYGPLYNRKCIISFNLYNIHAYDVGSILNEYSIVIRTGHHCAMPLMRHFNINSMCRISLCMYNTFDDIDQLKDKLEYIYNLMN